MMGKGRGRAVETGQSLSVSLNGSLNIPPAPVYYPTEEEFRDPLDYICKIRPEAEPYGICKIVPPKSWNPPFALDLNTFTFPTKTQAIHQLQARPASCDSKTFELEYNRFLYGHCGKQLKKRVVFEGEELDLCKLFNAVRRFGGYDKVGKEKSWGEVFKFVRSGCKISECAKHVLSQIYREHLYDYEVYHNRLNQHRMKGSKRPIHEGKKSEKENKLSISKRRWKNGNPEKVKSCDIEDKEDPDQICEQCNSGLHEEVMLLCDRCNKGWHTYCLSPPLKQVPPGNWYCFECLNSDKESFGFVPGKQFALEAFRRVAFRGKRKWFGSSSASKTQIEKKFWDIVEGVVGEVEVMYGSDLDTSVYGSGFPRPNDQRPEFVDEKLWDEYCSSPWNLNNLPKLKGSMLRAVNHNITGVMVPWLYVGMLFSAFCWHFEDHCFYSMNYMHWGEPKCWYSVPGNKADAFEKVMRICLPDLFDAQPDLLFQLVTMLNPSILCEKGVPVYSVLQEPGAFVVTFPRSYHGGFNLGLNCAEAVNFAPADWLPHGGFGAGLYQLYHKSAVLSHEELLCVVAKLNDWDSKTVPHLKKELERIYVREKTWRERLWRSGIVKSSPMPCRKSPEYVGTEEDPACVICRQYLYLSAVVCRCRPSTFVCLEHHEQLCECQYRRRRILYRYSLAELSDMVLKVEVHGFEATPGSNGLRRKMITKDSPPLIKKVKSSNISFSQLAEEWLLHASKVLQSPFSAEGYATSIKEAEQFLWAGSDVDPLRDMVKTLTEVRDWSEGVRDCLSKIENLRCDSESKSEKLPLQDLTKLVNIDSVPCNEAGYLKLKAHVEEAERVAQEIDAALTTCSQIEELEVLYSRVSSLPVHVKQSEMLLKKISSVKAWKENAKQHILDKLPKPVEVSILYKLKSEIIELQVQVPGKELVLDLARQADLCQTRCMSILSDAVRMEDVEVLIKEVGDFTVSLPELTLIKQYKADASHWYTRLNKVLLNAHQRDDQQSVINELDSILKDGASLKIRVEELPLVETELKKALCRDKALKARDAKVSLESLQHLVMEASVLQIEEEGLFAGLSKVVDAAVHWEECAKDILEKKGQMDEFEDLIRISEDIGAILPSLDEVKELVAVAKFWLKNSEPFLKPGTSVAFSAHSSLTLEALKELVSQSLSLQISMEEVSMLEVVLARCNEWAVHAHSLLHDVECLYDTSDIGDGRNEKFISKIETLVISLESITETGFSLHVAFEEILQLQNACSTLRWCSKVLSLCCSVLSYKVNTFFEEVQGLVERAGELAITSSPGVLLSSLIKGLNWLNRASELFSTPLNGKNCTLGDAEEILAQYQVINIAFPQAVEQLLDAVQKHRVWQEQVNQTFSLTCEERKWSDILLLKEHGETCAFSCPERDMILSEIQKVDHWKGCCSDVVETVAENANLTMRLLKIKESVERALWVYENSRCSEEINLCIICTSYSEGIQLLSCSTCQDRYHMVCLTSTLIGVNCPPVDLCPYCQSSLVLHPLGGYSPLSQRLVCKRPDIRMLEKLLSNSDHLCVRIKERDILQDIVDKAFELKKSLEKILEFERSYVDESIVVVSKELSTALKVIEVVGIDDNESYHDLKQAIGRNSWRFRVRRLLEGLEKPTVQQVQQHLKEGMLMNIPQENYYRKRLTVIEEMGVQWAEQAREVATDSGALPLHEVFEVITEGERLPVLVEEELKSLRARSMLHCICRKPYNEKSMVACRHCSEWYHMTCVRLNSRPKFYICAACEPLIPVPVDLDSSQSGKWVEPKTPSPRHCKSRKKAKKAGDNKRVGHKFVGVCDEDEEDKNDVVVCSSSSNSGVGIHNLWWRTRKPFRRAARKRARLDFASLFFS